MFPILFKIGPITLHTYGLLVALGIVAGIHVCIRQAALDGFPGPEVKESLYRMAFYLVVAGLVGARLFYVATHPGQFAGDWLEIFKVWHGGLVFYGGLLGAVIGFWLWNRSKPFNASWRLAADWAAPSLAFGHALGRLGCLAAGCCYGNPTEAPWGITFTYPESLAPLGLPLHPAQFYEFAYLAALGCFLIFMLSLARKDPNRVPGTIFLQYIILYSAGRLVLEFFRGDEPRFRGLSSGQITSLFVFAAGIALRLRLRKRGPAVSALILLALMVFPGRARPSDLKIIAQSTTTSLEVYNDGGKTVAEKRSVKIAIPKADGKEMMGRVLILRDPVGGVHWWAFYQTSSTQAVDIDEERWWLDKNMVYFAKARPPRIIDRNRFSLYNH